MFQVLRSLNYLKQNKIFHRDLKPENIMFECFDEEFGHNFIKLIDFGLAIDKKV